ncbi:hypothetical protein AB5I41_25595 [Sphingomonas sp. MMS24-JH45]
MWAFLPDRIAGKAGRAMSPAQVFLSAIGATGAGIAVFAGWRDRRRRLRADMDAVGWVDWPLVQMLAIFALAAAGLLAWKG